MMKSRRRFDDGSNPATITANAYPNGLTPHEIDCNFMGPGGLSRLLLILFAYFFPLNGGNFQSLRRS